MSVSIKETEDLQSEIQKLNESLRKSEELNRSILKDSPEIIALTDLQGFVIETSDKAAVVYEFESPKEIIGKSIFDFLDFSSKEKGKNLFFNMTNPDRLKVAREFKAIKANGKVFDVEVTGDLIRDKNDKPLNMIFIIRDITLKKQQEKQIEDLNLNLEKIVIERTLQLEKTNEILLREIEERKLVEEALKIKKLELENFFNIALDLLCIADTSGNFIKLNKAWELILGYPVEKLENKKFLDFVHPDDIQKTLKALKKLEDQQSVVNFINRYLTKDNQYRFIEWHSVPIGSLIYASARDITDKIKFQNALEQSIKQEKELNELKSRFITVASHEFRTPLSSILLSAETLLAYRKKLSEAQIENKLRNINHQVLHLESIVSNVMMVSKIQEGKIKADLKKADLVGFCFDTLSEYNNDINLMHKIEFKTEFTELFVKFDFRLMKHILLNLITNALKYSQPDPVVEISLYQKNKNIILSVSDNGIGIPEEDYKQIFQPFFRAKNTKNIEGNGLGLNIVKESVKLQGFDISFRSDIHKGTIFYIYIPI